MILRHILFGCALAIPAAAQLPGLDGGTARQGADIARPPWSSLVRVQSGATGHCTGVMIAPDRVLTAAHCLVARRTRQVLRPGGVHVLAGYDRGRFTGHAVAAGLRLGLGFDPVRMDQTGADWAVLRLATPLPGPPLPLAALPRPGTAAMLGGWQQDRAHALLADSDCRIEAVMSDPRGRLLLRHGCAATSGVSGGPLLVRQGGGWAVAGIAVGGSAGRRGGIAVAVAGLDPLR